MCGLGSRVETAGEGEWRVSRSVCSSVVLVWPRVYASAVINIVAQKPADAAVKVHFH